MRKLETRVLNLPAWRKIYTCYRACDENERSWFRALRMDRYIFGRVRAAMQPVTPEEVRLRMAEYREVLCLIIRQEDIRTVRAFRRDPQVRTLFAGTRLSRRQIEMLLTQAALP